MRLADAEQVAREEGISDGGVYARLAVAVARDNQFADLFLTTFRTAVELRPEAVRTLLADLFDLSLWEREARRVQGSVGYAIRSVQEIRDLIGALREEVERLVAQVETAIYECSTPTGRAAGLPQPKRE